MRGWSLFCAASVSAMVLAAFTPTPVIAQDDGPWTEAQPDDRPAVQELPAADDDRTPTDVDDHHLAATAAAAPAAAVVSGPAVGSVVSSLPPACVASVRRNIDYRRCGDVWYQPRRVGASVSYVVVNRP